MMPRLTFQMAPVELVQTLKRDGATLLGAEPHGNFLPCPALLALLADEVNKRFEAAAIGLPAAAIRLSSIVGFRIHSLPV